MHSSKHGIHESVGLRLHASAPWLISHAYFYHGLDLGPRCVLEEQAMSFVSFRCLDIECRLNSPMIRPMFRCMYGAFHYGVRQFRSCQHEVDRGLVVGTLPRLCTLRQETA